MAPLLPSSSAEAATYLKRMKIEAIRSFSACENKQAYSSPLFLRHLLERQGSELESGSNPTCSSHTMLLLPDQTYEREDECFLSILCAECRHHFHVQTYKGLDGALNDADHPGHMLLPIPQDFLDDHLDYKHNTDDAQFICAVENCLHMVKLSVMPPKLTAEQISKLQDDNRMITNLKFARIEDPERYFDVSDAWAAGSTIPTLIKYIEDRLAKPLGHVLRIKKRNKKFRVAFGDDLDDLLRSLGFDEKADEEGEECWYITEPEMVEPGHPTPVHTRRAHIQDTLEELRTLLPSSSTTPAWDKLMETFPGYLPRREVDIVTARGLSTDDTTLLGCLREFPPQWFSWAAILLSGLCPSRRDEFLDAGLRCIRERNEDASLSIIMYRSKFDELPTPDPQVQAASEFFGVSVSDARNTRHILNRYHLMVAADASNSFRTRAAQHLEIISNYLGEDLLGEVARGDSLASSSLSSSGNRRMSIASASRLLKVSSDFSADLIREFAANVDDQVERGKVIEALEVLSDLKQQQGQHGDAQSLRDTAEFLRATREIATSLSDKPSLTEQPITTEPVTEDFTPPGLKNIGNTCYLNSLLQYFYNVKAVREMVLNYDQIQLELDDVAVHNRRTGGNGTRVTIEEAIVARQFVQELRLLFLELHATAGAAATPSQKLANTALSSAKEILTSKSQNEPPPLPARPSPAPPKEPAGMNVNVEPANEAPDLVRSTSSRTLVNEIENASADMPSIEKKIDSNGCPPGQVRELSPEDRALSDTEHIEDVTMEDPNPQAPLTLEQKIAEVARRLEQSDRSGTSQQDVEEIIGNILEHLMRAIRPHGPIKGKPDLQADKVTELFFTTIVNSTIRTKIGNEKTAADSSVHEDILNEEVVPERWITAFPHPDKERKVKNNLYEALDRYFSYELLLDSDLARYTTIRALPPIVHICIQRSDASGVKNKNPVIIPMELYLDRYMEAETGSDLWNTRRRVWAIKERIKELESRYCVENILREPGSQTSQTWNAQTVDGGHESASPKCEELIDLKSDLWQDLRPRSKRTLETAQLAEPTETEPAKRRSRSRDTVAESYKFADTLWDAGRSADEANSKELDSLRGEQAGAFDSMKQHKYCLHAMICHAGGMNAGHYWVWVRDFKKQVWYKYNDSLVTEDSRDSQQVIDELNTSGDPYYVAYVRDDLKDELVEVPRRAQRDVGTINPSELELEVIDSVAVDTPPQPANSPANSGIDVAMGDVLPLELQS
ncbi:cysteine proteinase [Xylaria nigripes]|nr:cysteine proteinase [Xylaria nigripes]